LYAYVGNDPINATDPDGKCAKRKKKKADKACKSGAAAGSRLPIPHPLAKGAAVTGMCVAGRVAACNAPDWINAQIRRLISKVDNTIDDHVTDEDLRGVKIEVAGGITKRRSDGEPYDHIDEVAAARRSLVTNKDKITDFLDKNGKKLSRKEKKIINTCAKTS